MSWAPTVHVEKVIQITLGHHEYFIDRCAPTEITSVKCAESAEKINKPINEINSTYGYVSPIFITKKLYNLRFQMEQSEMHILNVFRR